MSHNYDFEQVMSGSEGLSSDSSRQHVVNWTKGAMERLASLVDEEQEKAILTGCACHYPHANLKEMREAYAATRDVALVNILELSDDLIQEIVRRGWGVAGVIEGDTIVATKIPKSGYLVAYMNEPDPEKKRLLYCHCPRIRDVLKTSETISPTYCYCGAGYYKGIWEEILQEPVEVEVLKSVLGGDEVCTVAIHLPLHE